MESPGGGITIPLPEDNPIPGLNAEEVALEGSVLSGRRQG